MSTSHSYAYPTVNSSCLKVARCELVRLLINEQSAHAWIVDCPVTITINGCKAWGEHRTTPPHTRELIISQSRSKDFPGFSVGWSCGARSASWQSATIRWFLTIETYCSASIVEEYLILPLDPPQLTACTSILERNQTEIIRI